MGRCDRIPFQVLVNEIVVIAVHSISVTSDWERRRRGKMTVFWDVAQCSWVKTDPDRGACCLHLLPLWRPKVALKHKYCSTRLHGVTYQKISVLMIIQNPTRCKKLRPWRTLSKGLIKGMCHVKVHCVANEPKLSVPSFLSLIWKIYNYRIIVAIVSGPGRWG
jgi:hypothetical protein